VRKEQLDNGMSVGDLPQCPLLSIGDLDAQVCKGSDELAWGVEIDAWKLFHDLSGQALLVSTRTIPQRGPGGNVDRQASLLKPNHSGNCGELEGGNFRESFTLQPSLARYCCTARNGLGSGAALVGGIARRAWACITALV
jgi:hypothetical protein